MQSLSYSPLGRVYSFILSWPDLEEDAAAKGEMDSEAHEPIATADTQLGQNQNRAMDSTPARPARQTTEK